MELWLIGLVVQTVGAALLSVIFIYLSRGKGNRILQAAGYAWLFLFLALISLLLLTQWTVPYDKPVYQYFKFLYIAALCIAAIRMNRNVSLAKPLAVTAVAAIPLSLLIVQMAGRDSRLYAVHNGILAMGWLLVAVFIYQSPQAGLGRQFAGLLALVTAAVEFAYVVLFGMSAAQQNRPFQPLGYTGFYD